MFRFKCLTPPIVLLEMFSERFPRFKMLKSIGPFFNKPNKYFLVNQRQVHCYLELFKGYLLFPIYTAQQLKWIFQKFVIFS